jgi:hypothetical protein
MSRDYRTLPSFSARRKGAKHMLTRYQDWPIQLAAFIESAYDMPFVWGEHDCCLFACSGVQILTGTDPALNWRGKYNSRESAMFLARIKGYETLYDIANGMAKECNIQERPVKTAQRGDIVLHTSPNPVGLGTTLGIVDGSHCYGPGDFGLIATPMTDVWNDPKAKAWKIG